MVLFTDVETLVIVSVSLPASISFDRTLMVLLLLFFTNEAASVAVTGSTLVMIMSKACE